MLDAWVESDSDGANAAPRVVLVSFGTDLTRLVQGCWDQALRVKSVQDYSSRRLQE